MKLKKEKVSLGGEKEKMLQIIKEKLIYESGSYLRGEREINGFITIFTSIKNH